MWDLKPTTFFWQISHFTRFLLTDLSANRELEHNPTFFSQIWSDLVSFTSNSLVTFWLTFIFTPLPPAKQGKPEKETGGKSPKCKHHTFCAFWPEKTLHTGWSQLRTSDAVDRAANSAEPTNNRPTSKRPPSMAVSQYVWSAPGVLSVWARDNCFEISDALTSSVFCALHCSEVCRTFDQGHCELKLWSMKLSAHYIWDCLSYLPDTHICAVIAGIGGFASRKIVFSTNRPIDPNVHTRKAWCNKSGVWWCPIVCEYD